MAVSSFQDLTWRDDHTVFLSHLYSLYHSGVFSRSEQLCDMGYRGFPDPKYETSNGTITTDFLAYNTQGDAQHISIIDGEGLSAYNEPTHRLVEQIQQAEKMNEISSEMVSDYLTLRDEDFIPKFQEHVLLLPNDLYTTHKGVLEEEIGDRDFILWLIETNGSAKIWKEHGKHTNLDLDSELDRVCNTYRSGTNLLQFTRGTSRNRLQFEFTQRLIKYCARHVQQSFSFEEVDNIMVSSQPPMLEHLTKREREEDYWREFIYTLIRRFSLLKAVGGSKYKWKKQQFLREPRYRQQILNKLATKLDLVESK